MSTRRAAGIALLGTVVLAGGCYLYHTPPSAQPAIVAPVLAHADAVADLDSLVAIVREVHPDPGPRLVALRDSLDRVWPASLTRAQLWRDLSRVLATMGDGHTSLWTPNEEINAALAAGQRTFPLGVTRTESGIVVASVLGTDSSRVAVGERLVRVGDTSVEDVARELGRAASAELDSYRDRAVLGSFGTRLWLEGIRVPLEVTVARGGNERTVTIEGATLADFQRRLAPRARPALTARRTSDSVLLLDFTNMGSDANVLKARLDSAFGAARTEGVRAVVVDLRRNSGGNSKQGITLLSYVTSQPLQEGLRKEWRASTRYRSYMKSGMTPLIRWLPLSWIDGSTGGFFSVDAGEIATTSFDKPAPPPGNPLRIEKPLCMLIGPGTFSSAMMLANTVRQSNIGTLIGEPTGEPPNSHGEVLSYRLAKSGLAGQVSSARFVLDPDSSAYRRGVLPHIAVARSTADVVAGRDPVMERAMACGRDASRSQ